MTPEELAAQAAAAAADNAPTPETPPAAPVAEEVDDFAAAFESFNEPTPKPAEAAKPAAPVAPTEPATAAAPAAPAEPTKPAAPATPTPSEPLAQAPAAPTITPEAWAALQEEIKELRAAKAAPTPTPTPAPAAEAPPIYQPAEATTLEQYRKDWPDVAAGEALARRAEHHALVQHIFAELAPIINPLLQRTDAIQETTQYRELKAAIPDYDEVRDPVIAWVDKQPAYLKTAYTQVTQSGSPADIADLVARFKKETNYAAPTPTPAAAPAAPAAVAAPAAPKPNAALPAAAAAAAAALKPVVSKRSETTGEPDPNDFDAAFAEFAAIK